MWLNHFTFLVNMCVTGIWIHFLSKHLSLYMCPGRLQCKAIWMGFVSALEMRRSRELGLIWHTCGAKEIQSSSWTGAWGGLGRGYWWEGFHCGAAPYGLELEFPSYISLYRGHNKGSTGRIQLVARGLNDLLSRAYAVALFIDKSRGPMSYGNF